MLQYASSVAHPTIATVDFLTNYTSGSLDQPPTPTGLYTSCAQTASIDPAHKSVTYRADDDGSTNSASPNHFGPL
eukprot:m.48512 g.48512  ORF g.48512 m.48512 type:complete len:75 (-) comp15882_c0_seq1:106-330(-)